MVLVAVVTGVLLALGAFYMATIDSLQTLAAVADYGNLALETEARLLLREKVVTGIVKSVDGYLIASIMLIFSLGLYELFVSKIESAHDDEASRSVLHIKSLDDLKDRLAKVVLLILVIEFFQYALKMKYAKPLDLGGRALGTLFVGGALYLSGAKPRGW